MLKGYHQVKNCSLLLRYQPTFCNFSLRGRTKNPSLCTYLLARVYNMMWSMMKSKLKQQRGRQTATRWYCESTLRKKSATLYDFSCTMLTEKTWSKFVNCMRGMNLLGATASAANWPNKNKKKKCGQQSKWLDRLRAFETDRQFVPKPTIWAGAFRNHETVRRDRVYIAIGS